MRTVIGVMLLAMLSAVPAMAQVTAPTESQAEPVAPSQEPAATAPAPAAPAPVPAPAPVAAAPQAPAPDPQETLFGDGDVDHGGYGGPQLKLGRVAAGDALFVGGKGGWIINHNLAIGGGGWGMANQRDAPDRFQSVAGDRRVITVGYGGALLEYFIRPEKVFHGTVGLLIGGGGLNLHDRGDCHDGDGDCMGRYDERDGLSDSFFVLEPEAGLEVNVLKFMRVNAGVSYRYVTGIGGIGFENDDLRSFNGTMTFRFGVF